MAKGTKRPKKRKSRVRSIHYSKEPVMTQKIETGNPGMDQINNAMVKTWNDKSLPASDRAQWATYQIAEHGLDYVPALAQLIKNSDEAGQVTDMLKTLGEEPLITSRYIGPAKVSGVGKLACAILGVKYAWVTAKDTVKCLPCDIEGQLRPGDMVLISPKVERIVGKDGDLASPGTVVSVEAIPEGTQGRVIVKAPGDQQVVAWLHHSLMENPPVPGDKVVYDESHRFVLGKISTDTDGKELLSVLANLPIVNRCDVGSPHPIAEQIVNHFRDAFERPEWLEQMGTRDRRGYLFIGQTGGGKSYHIKLIATEIHDLMEQHTGSRTSRVIMCDASQFWDPYFGATEQKINAWAKKVSALGSQKVINKDGDELKVPILGVIEECEALFRSRGGDQQASGHLFDRVLALLLQKLESVENAIGVPIVWCCSTNRPDLIDAAAMRRIGMRKAIFGNLDAEATAKVMLTKVAGIKNANHEKIVMQVVKYLHESEDGQVMAEVSLANGKKRPLHRRELVTPSILEEAVSFAVDKCISASRESGRLQQVHADEVVQFLDQHFNHMAGMLTKHNIPEYCPEWFADDPTPVQSIKVIR